MKKFFIVSLALCLAALSCSCSSTDSESSDNEVSAEPSSSESEDTEAESQYTLYADFSKGLSDDFYPADGWSNDPPFNCLWTADNCRIEDGVIQMVIDEQYDGRTTGAEYRTNEMYGYGLYECSMKPIKNPGVVSSFLTYTGPYEGDPWDEVDIEFLGKDTTQVQFNYFGDGSEGHDYVYDLGFDASEDFHTYGFRWLEDSITWYVDGEAVYEVVADDIPTTPGRIMITAWTSIGVDDWTGAYDGTTPLAAEYEWVRFTAEE